MAPEPFPRLLKRFRKKRKWSQQRFAEALCEASGRATVGRQEVYRWESGRRAPKFWRPYIAEVLGVTREELEASIAEPSQPEPSLAELLPEEHPAVELSTAQGRRIGRSVVDRLNARVHALRLADDVLPGHDLVLPAYRELDSAVAVLNESTHSEAVGSGLRIAVGELAQIAGWIASDAGQHDRAEETYRLGLHAAREAGDSTLAGQLAGSLAYQWSNTGREADGVVLAEAALAEGVDEPPRARALFWDRIAWARTKADDVRGTIRALSEASEALSRHGGEEEPTWLYWVDSGELQVMEARAYTELRRPLRAIPLLNDVLSRYDTSHTRELALYLSWLAVAYTDVNEPEQAAAIAQRMLGLAADLGSDRTGQRAQTVRKALEPYRAIPEVREVLEAA
jgi:transcriptional regulator with XRE-family HTH domain